jgi:SAM-dependent methyltransferase
MASLIPQHPLGRRLVYELIHLARVGRTALNVGFSPVQPAIGDDPDFASEQGQIQLYAELLALLPFDDDQWRKVSVLEVGAAGGSGLRFLQKRYQPREIIGIELSTVAAWRGRRQGADIRQGDASKLPFPASRFDCVLCIDALSYFHQETFFRELRRVTKPGGRVMLGQGMPGTLDQIQHYFRHFGAMSGLEVESFHDLAAGVRRSIIANARRAQPILRLWPRCLRLRAVENFFMLPGGERFEQWQSGFLRFGVAILRRS